MNDSLKLKQKVLLNRVPQAVIRDRNKFPETWLLFNRAVGNKFTIQSFNQIGMAEVYVLPDGSEGDACADSLFVEPEYLVVIHTPE